jgi:hypothetical protein
LNKIHFVEEVLRQALKNEKDELEGEIHVLQATMDTESEIISRGNTPNRSGRNPSDLFTTSTSSSSFYLNHELECPNCRKKLLTSDSLTEPLPLSSSLGLGSTSKNKSKTKIKTTTGGGTVVPIKTSTTTTDNNSPRPASKSTQRASNGLLSCPSCDFTQSSSLIRDNSFYLSNHSVSLSLSSPSPSSSYPSPSPSSSSTMISRPGTAVSRPGTAGGGGISRVRSKIQAARDEKHFVDEEIYRR